MHRCINIILHQSFTKKYSILVVITFPGHETNKRILSKSKLSTLSRRSICDYFAFFDMIAFEYNWSLVIAVGLIASHKLGQRIYRCCSIIILDRNLIGNRFFYSTCLLCHNTYTRVNGCFCFHTRSNNWCLCCKKRHCLTLHVGTHQGTVCIVVLQKRNQCRSYREHHLRRYIHVIEHGLIVFLCLIQITSGNGISYEMSFFIQFFVCLCYMVIIFLIRCHINNFICNPRILWIGFIYFTVWSLYETILVDSSIACQRVDKTDIRSFRRLNRAHSSVMGIMNVSNLESGTVSGQTTRS